jgi:hypothetical protein
MELNFDFEKKEDFFGSNKKQNKKIESASQTTFPSNKSAISTLKVNPLKSIRDA